MWTLPLYWILSIVDQIKDAVSVDTCHLWAAVSFLYWTLSNVDEIKDTVDWTCITCGPR